MRQLQEALEESNLETGTYRTSKEALQVECARRKRENDELKKKLRDQEETLHDVLVRTGYSGPYLGTTLPTPESAAGAWNH